MCSGFQPPITIKDAIDRIHSRRYLLPAIQRKFTWSSDQIEMLFDSIMRGYPINSFMMWRISNDDLKSEYKFYEFITCYREFFAENNTDIDTNGVPDFEAVIDGQQRLTSLYIGLRGTYAYRMPRKWLRNTEDSLPTRKLYLNIGMPVQQEYDNQKVYDFRFLSKDDLAKFNNAQGDSFWFEVGQILNMVNLIDVNKYLKDNRIDKNEYAVNTLIQLYQTIHTEKLINYYLQEDQDSDKVLDIFIRTNSGGTPLSFSDLLMSIASANWKHLDARHEIESIIQEIYNIGGKTGFRIDKDFVLKTCLVLFVENIKFQLKNFTYENVRIFENNWTRVRESIVAAFALFEELGFNDITFRAKNAAIPIIYYIYHNNLADSIVKSTYSANDKDNITRWLLLTFIKSIFSGQSDTILVTMRKVLRENINHNFPAQELMDAFRNDPTKNYGFDDEFLDGLLEAQKDSNEAFYVLHLLYPRFKYNQSFHQDHLHPATIFNNKEKLTASIPEADKQFAEDKKNWNSVANLQLLDELQNQSKKDSSLADWVSKKSIPKCELFVNDTTSLDIKDFKSFITDRKIILKANLRDVIAPRPQ